VKLNSSPAARDPPEGAGAAFSSANAVRRSVPASAPAARAVADKNVRRLITTIGHLVEIKVFFVVRLLNEHAQWSNFMEKYGPKNGIPVQRSIVRLFVCFSNAQTAGWFQI
jgi:hypothetical protein